jgi:shikimate kinase
VVKFEDRNIVLTGFMGTGKSTVGRRLATALGFTWVDTDRMIETRHGPIDEIFARAGEMVFRGIERNIVSELSSRIRCVFSTGGKMLLDPQNIRAFSAQGRIFCLTANTETLVTRLMNSPTPRPLLEGPDPEGAIRRLLDERREGYARFTQVESTDGSPDAVTARLVDLVTTPTATPTGRRGHAVLGDATTCLAPPVVVVGDPAVTAIHGPCLGPVDRETTTLDDTADAGSVVLLGGSSITCASDTSIEVPHVVVPTTPDSMERSFPAATRVIADLATLQTYRRETP